MCTLRAPLPSVFPELKKGHMWQCSWGNRGCECVLPVLRSQAQIVRASPCPCFFFPFGLGAALEFELAASEAESSVSSSVSAAASLVALGCDNRSDLGSSSVSSSSESEPSPVPAFDFQSALASSSDSASLLGAPAPALGAAEPAWEPADTACPADSAIALLAASSSGEGEAGVVASASDSAAEGDAAAGEGDGAADEVASSGESSSDDPLRARRGIFGARPRREEPRGEWSQNGYGVSLLGRVAKVRLGGVLRFFWQIQLDRIESSRKF